jgi:hypothetical protein
MTIPGYEVTQELARRNWYALHRGRRLEDKRPVLLKTPRHDPPGVTEVGWLEREFEFLRALSVPGVPRAYALLRHNGSCCLVLEDHGGLPLQALFMSHRPALEHSC